MKLYKIRNWTNLFENNRSRELKSLDWVPIPNHHDGENFTAIMTHPDGAEIFAAWVLIIQVASKCDPRGTLLRGNAMPHDSTSLALKTRAPAKWFKVAFSFIEEHTDWFDVEEVATNPAPNCGNPASGCIEGNGMEQNGIEEKGTLMSGKPDVMITNSRIVIHYLNEKSGRRFRESNSTFRFIMARLREPDVTLDGVKQMIDRQVSMWKGKSLEEYLRPSTLFNETKFNEYYSAKDLPLPPAQNNGHVTAIKPDHSKGF